jgi:hypothetical protein
MIMSSFVKNASALVLSVLAATVAAGCAAQAGDPPSEGTNEAAQACDSSNCKCDTPAPEPVPVPAPVGIPAPIPTPIPAPVPAAVPVPVPFVPCTTPVFLPGFGCDWMGGEGSGCRTFWGLPPFLFGRCGQFAPWGCACFGAFGHGGFGCGGGDGVGVEPHF